MQKKAFLATAFMAASAMLLAIAPSMAQDKVTITWFIGLGTDKRRTAGRAGTGRCRFQRCAP
jgi:ABC-type sugar transport system substrate-binding protein